MKFLKSILSRETQDVQTMMAEAALSDKFQNWCRSDVGRYVIGRAEQQEVSVLRELADANPDDTIGIIQLQEAAKVPGMILKWIEEVIVNGEAAKFQLAELDGDE